MTTSLFQKVKETAVLRAFGLFKIPMLFFIRPVVEEINDERCVVRVPLSRRTKNHLGSMYFGALAAGADCAAGLIAMRRIMESGNQVALIFKDFHADYAKRAEGDVLFTSTQGREVSDLVKRAMDTGERVDMPVRVVATVPALSGDEPVATFTLTLSLKRTRR